MSSEKQDEIFPGDSLAAMVPLTIAEMKILIVCINSCDFLDKYEQQIKKKMLYYIEDAKKGIQND